MAEQDSWRVGGWLASTPLRSLFAGLVAGFATLVTCVSFATLIFRGPLASHLATGITVAAMTAVIAGGLICLFSACRPLVALPDDDTAPVMALMISLLVAALPAGMAPDALLLAALAALTGTALLTGLVLALLGQLRLGSLARFLPFSVIGGYSAGVGLLLLQGALGIGTGLALATPAEMLALLEPAVLPLWLPLLLGAGLIRLAMARLQRSLGLPVAMIALVAFYYGGQWLLGHTPAELMAAGALIGPLPDSTSQLPEPVLLSRAAEIDWASMLGNAGAIGTILVLSVVSLTLSVSSLALQQRQHLDMNRELRVAGVANIVSGLSGGLLALPSTALSSLAVAAGAPPNRAVGLLVTAFCGAALYLAFDLIAWLPRFLVASLLLYLGLSFLERWLVSARRQLAPLEYAIVVLIVLVVAFAGFLQGVFIGLLGAIVLFVVNYSRVDVVRYAVSSRELRSTVERKRAETELLAQLGDQVLIMKLQGYLFFGTVSAVETRVRQRLEADGQPPLSFLVIDLALVTGMDSSAYLSLDKLAQQSAESRFYLLLTGVPEALQLNPAAAGLERRDYRYLREFSDLDHGLEWVEQKLLARQPADTSAEGLVSQLSGRFRDQASFATLIGYFQHREVVRGEVLARQDEPSEELFLLESCSASVYLSTDSGQRHRIRRAGIGTLFGEVGFYLGTPRTATVEVDTPGELYVLDRDAHARLEREHPELAAVLHRFMIEVISRRLQHTTTTLRAVLR